MIRQLLLASLTLGAAMGCMGETAPPFHVAQTVHQFQPEVNRHWRGARTQGLRTTIWFPVDANLDPQAEDIGSPGQHLFKTYPLVVGAALSPARETYPLVVMSHGTGGSAASLDWLAAPLAAAGYVVAAVDHPGNNTLEPLTWDGFTLWWERATDVSGVLDGVLADPIIGPRIDRARIAAVGFSLGGYTVLELAGARSSQDAFLAFCDSPRADATCRPPEMDLVVDRPGIFSAPSSQRKASLARAEASYKDQRVKAVFAIAPAVGQAFGPTSFDEVDIPVELLAGTADVHVPPATNVQHIAELLPGVELTLLPGAGHYSFVSVCAEAMVARDAALCAEGAGADRTAIHAQAIAKVTAFLAKALASGRTADVTSPNAW
jgi:predicted dienelactone hydrolase